MKLFIEIKIVMKSGIIKIINEIKTNGYFVYNNFLSKKI